jgi:hypothetical protein
MRVIGFHFDRIAVEKLKDRAENIKINTEIDVPELKQIKTDVLKTKEEILEARFSYIIKYDPDLAKIELKGKVVLALDSKAAKEALKGWKSKKMPEEFRLVLFNFIIRKSNVKALALEDEMNLPLHLPFPSLRKQED